MNKYLNGHFYIDQTLLFCHRSGALVIQDQVRDHDVAMPALLCHEEPAQGTQSLLYLGQNIPDMGGIFCLSLVLYGIRAPSSVHGSHLSCHNNTPKCAK